jgi:hypothetical protein
MQKMFNWLDHKIGTVEKEPARAPAPHPNFNGSIALARLDERLAAAPAPVRAGWVSRALIHEAVASLRLNDGYITPADLTLMLAETLYRIPNQDLGRAVENHRMLATLMRRNPQHMFSPLRVIALTRLRLHGNLSQDERIPEWLRQTHRNPTDMRDALKEALHPEAVVIWRSLPPLEAAGMILARWHSTGAADTIGAAPGRALAMAWVHRTGLTSGYYLLPSVGFLGHAADYRPDLDGRWRERFPQACERAADWGIKLHRRLASSYLRMHEAAPGKRATSRIAAVIDLLVARSGVSANDVAKSVGITADAARALLGRLEKEGLAQEITGRGSFRLYSLPG